jgi:hypothetical protein
MGRVILVYFSLLYAGVGKTSLSTQSFENRFLNVNEDDYLTYGEFKYPIPNLTNFDLSQMNAASNVSLMKRLHSLTYLTPLVRKSTGA